MPSSKVSYGPTPTLDNCEKTIRDLASALPTAELTRIFNDVLQERGVLSNNPAGSVGDFASISLVSKETNTLPTDDDMATVSRFDSGGNLRGQNNERLPRKKRYSTHKSKQCSFTSAAVGLVGQVFPQEVIEHLVVDSCETIAKAYGCVSVIFTDIAGFTAWSSRVPPNTICECLSSLYQIMDDLAEQFDIYKVETIGDAWMGVCGAPHLVPNHAELMAKFALELRNLDKEIQCIFGDETMGIRIGLHCGMVVAGVVHADRPRWQLFGDTVNMASRMESTGVKGSIQISKQMHDALEESPTKFLMESRGKVEVKGKGEIETFFLNGKVSSVCFAPQIKRLSLLRGEEEGGSESDTASRRSSIEDSQHSECYQADLLCESPAGKPEQGSRSAPESSIPPECSAASVANGDDKKTSVLLVDDKPSVLLVCQRFLQKIGVDTIMTATSGSQALQLMQQHIFDIVFMDINMPGMSGKEIVSEFRLWESQSGIAEDHRQYIVAISSAVGDGTNTGCEVDDTKSSLLEYGFNDANSKENFRQTISRQLKLVADRADRLQLARI